jgi:lysozyme
MSKPIVPPTRPNLTREKAEAYFAAPYSGLDFEKYPLYCLGIRGYYTKSMGDPTRNDLGIYDDALFLIGKDLFLSFNANTDPAKVLRGSGSRKGTATLVPGQYFCHVIDLHQNRYPALCQRAGNVGVWRYRTDGARWTDVGGSFGINIHSGGMGNTNSEGCQTVHPYQWPEFMHTVVETIGLTGWGKTIVPYLLIEY